jgi:hypothetical protein
MASPLPGLLIWLLGVTAFAVLVVALFRLSLRAGKALEGVSAQRATILMLETRVAMLEKTVRALNEAKH